MSIWRKIKKVFAKYPDDKINPTLFNVSQQKANADDGDRAVLAVQILQDKFFYLLFGLLSKKIKEVNSIQVDGLVVGSVNATIGTGLTAELLRLPLVMRLRIAPWIRAYGQLVDRIPYRCATWGAPWQMWQDWSRAATLQRVLAEKPVPRKLKIDGIEVADLIVDSYLRFKPSPRFEVDNKFVQRLIWQAIRDIRKAKQYFEQVKPKWYLTSYTTYLEHGVPARVAMQAGVQVISFGNLVQFCKKHKGQDWFHTSDFTKYKENFEQLKNPNSAIDEARKLLEFRLSGGIDQTTSYMKESAYKKQSKEMLPSDLNGAVVVFLHDFYDSPHVYPNLIFDDFWSWINTTIDILENAKINFYLKPHPNQVSLSDVALQRLKQERPDLKWLSPIANNMQLAQAGIVGGVTAYGTVAHELAYLGVPSVSCALHPHHAFDFSKTATTVLQYEELLKELHDKKTDESQLSQEALKFFWAHNLNKTQSEKDILSLKNKMWKKSQLPGHEGLTAMYELNSVLKLSEIFE